MEVPPMPYPVFDVDAWLKDNFYKDNDGIINQLENSKELNPENRDYISYGIFSKVGSRLYDNVRNYLIYNLMHYEQDNNKLREKSDHRFPEDGDKYLNGDGFNIMLIELFGKTFTTSNCTQPFYRDYTRYASMGKWHDKIKKLGNDNTYWGTNFELKFAWQLEIQRNEIEKVKKDIEINNDKSTAHITSLKSEITQLNDKISNHNNIITELQISNERTNKMIKYIILSLMFITLTLLMNVSKINIDDKIISQ
tara:strand:+ start:428 stop:1183 length:756 start_codon:yes stop_codon:yes gene_type:complete